MKETVSESPPSSRQRIGIAIVVLALLIRGCVCFLSVDQYAADPDAYRAIAETLGHTGVFGLTAPSGEPVPTAFRPPLYPYVLSWLLVNGKLTSLAVAALHTLLGCVTALCTYRASRQLFCETDQVRAGIVAAGLVIVDPILLQQSTLVMTETLATAIASIVLWWWVCHAERSCSVVSAVTLGLLLSLAFLCRPTFLVWAAMLCLCAALAPRRPAGLRARIGRAAILAAIVSITVGWWTIRNARAIGYPVWGTTHGGYTLLLGNNPLIYGYFREGEMGSIWNAEPFLLAYSHRYDADPRTEAFWESQWDSDGVVAASASEHDDDELAYEAAKATIEREPGMFMWSCVVRVGWLWAAFPHQTNDRSSAAVVAVGIYYSCLYVAIACGMWRLGRRFLQPKWWPISTLVVTLTLVHAVYWSNMRMRAPAIPSLAILAAAAIARIEKRDS